MHATQKARLAMAWNNVGFSSKSHKQAMHAGMDNGLRADIDAIREAVANKDEDWRPARQPDITEGQSIRARHMHMYAASHMHANAHIHATHMHATQKNA